jgi:urate oxidase
LPDFTRVPVHRFVEFKVDTMLESDMAHAFLTPSNAGMTATDTQKNAVYYVAKQMSQPCSPEEFAIALGRHFIQHYPLVWKAKINVEAAPWRRVEIDGKLHDHGFAFAGTEVRTAYVTVDRKGNVEVTGGVRDMRVLKTTQSGYEGFLHDEFTSLPDVTERMVASAVTASWKYGPRQPKCYDAAHAAARGAMMAAFFGPARGGVYSPSVQFTLYRMAKGAIDAVPEVSSVFLNMPNLHFLPCSPLTSTFEDDVYVATSEPHGNIEAVVTRGQVAPHCRL